MLTPYQFGSNRPIDGIDEDGLEYAPAGKNTGGVPRDNTAVTTVSEHPAITADNKSNAGYYDRLRTMSKSSIGKPAGASSTPVRINYDQKVHDANVAAAYSEAGYDKDGNRIGIYKLLENKSFNKLSENMLVPMAEMAAMEAVGSVGVALEIREASTKINFLRDLLNVKRTQNIALLEGEVGGIKINDIAISGNKPVLGTISAVNLERRVFSTQFAGGYDRLFDSEAKLLEGFAETFKSTPNIQGGIKLTSERPFCISCSGVVDQFKKMYPNVKVEVVNGIK